MAKDKTEKPEEIEKKPKFNIKVLLIGIPLFMIQLIIVYFITANFLLDKWKEGNQQLTANSNAELTSENKNEDNTSASQNELGKYVYLEEDVIVNPANTQGKRLLLTSIGFDLKSEENKTAMKEKEIPIRDMIITTLASKTIDQLNSISFRDSLKSEISQKVKNLIPNLKVNKVYFSKYIIQ
ncbi:flagellar basal body-associated protein FliL [bacterium BMS3Abin03]|nr:flagellar basal body-associated protein FliL [bacterium BMS3Abin03]